MTTLTDSSGSFTSPGYPETYGSKEKVKWKIKAGGPIKITCSFFDLEEESSKGKCKDFLQIKDVDKLRFCGKSGPQKYITSKSVVKIMFKSNTRNNFGGFTCSYSVIDNELIESALDAHNSNTCGSAPSNTCSCSGLSTSDSYQGQIISDDYRIIVSNGIPDHKYETGQERPNPNSACKHEVYMSVPLDPEKGDTYTEYRMGPVGIAFSGAFFYNHLSTPNGDVAEVQESKSFDTCNGHSDPKCRYHYHKIPVCMNDGANCTHVGYMMDGFSVYSFCSHPDDSNRSLRSCYYLNNGEDGSNKKHYTYSDEKYNSGECDLDRANGYTFSDSRGYAYVFTEDYPFIMAGYYGEEVGRICYV